MGLFQDILDNSKLGPILAARSARGLLDEQADSILASHDASADLRQQADALKQMRHMPTAQALAAYAGLRKAAITEQIVNTSVDGFNQENSGLSDRAQTDGERDSLATIRQSVDYARKLALSGDPQLEQEGLTQLSKGFADQSAFATASRAQQFQLQVSDINNRESRRKELQGQLDAQITAPMIQNRSQYQAIANQLAGQDANSTAPASLVTAVLGYAGAQLRQSGDGSWGFAVGPVSFSPESLPSMTYAELRNRLNEAFQGHEDVLRSSGQDILSGAAKQGFGVNGNRVSDLLFPLADAVHQAREREQPAASATNSPQGATDTGTRVGQKIDNFITAGANALRQVGFFKSLLGGDQYTDASGAIYKKIDRGNGRFEWQRIDNKDNRPTDEFAQ